MVDVLTDPGTAVANQDAIEGASFVEQWSERLHRAASFAGNVINGAFVALEVNPITNEGARLAAFGATQAAFENPYASAGAFTAATFAIEAAGAAATAKLLDTEQGHRLTERVNDVLDRMRLTNLLRTNLATESAVSMIAGAPAATVLKHRQDPERTFGDNLQYGLISSTGIAAVSGAESLLVAQSINHPNPLTIGAAALGLGLLVGGAKWIKSKWAGSAAREDLLEGEIVERVDAEYEPLPYNSYRAIMDQAARGPHIEGYNEQDYSVVMEDARTRTVGIEMADGSFQAWPVLSPIANSTEYMPGYFERHYPEDTPVYYLTLPTNEVISSQETFNRDLATEILQLAQEGAVIVYDERARDRTEEYIRAVVTMLRPDAAITVDDFTDPRNGTPAASIHFAGLFTADREGAPQLENSMAVPGHLADAVRSIYSDMVAAGELNADDESVKSLLVNPEDLDLPYEPGNPQTLMERLWDIYKNRFDWLIENNPSRGAQTLEELQDMLRDPNTLTAVYAQDDKVQAFTMFITDIKAANWLRPEFYAQQFPGETVVYFPGIASENKSKGGHASIALAGMITKVFSRAVDQARIVWQCTNVSARYIPRIVSMGVNSAGVGTIETPVETDRYNYRGIQISLPESEK